MQQSFSQWHNAIFVLFWKLIIPEIKNMGFEICLYKTAVHLLIFFELLVTVLKSSPLSNLISNFS